MNDIASSRSFYAGIGVYAVILLFAATPIFPVPLAGKGLVTLILTALVATLLTFAYVSTRTSVLLGDQAGAFFQGLLGMLVCAGLYAVVTPVAQPQIMILSLLWAAIGLPHFRLRHVLALLSVYSMLYAIVFDVSMTNSESVLHGESLYMAGISLIVGSFMAWRTYDYEHQRNVLNMRTAQIEDAEERLHNITTRDAETTALKHSYFLKQVELEKARVDRYDGDFSIGMIEIDGFDQLTSKIGKAATAQVLREFTERANRLIRKIDVLGTWPPKFQPLGRISEHRFGLLLPVTNLDGALRCAERLHTAVDFKSIRTHAGVVSLTFSIGVTQYADREKIGDIMGRATRALEQAQQHNGNDYKALKRVA